MRGGKLNGSKQIFFVVQVDQEDHMAALLAAQEALEIGADGVILKTDGLTEAEVLHLHQMIQNGTPQLTQNFGIWSNPPVYPWTEGVDHTCISRVQGNEADCDRLKREGWSGKLLAEIVRPTVGLATGACSHCDGVIVDAQTCVVDPTGLKGIKETLGDRKKVVLAGSLDPKTLLNFMEHLDYGFHFFQQSSLHDTRSIVNMFHHANNFGVNRAAS